MEYSEIIYLTLCCLNLYTKMHADVCKRKVLFLYKSSNIHKGVERHDRIVIFMRANSFNTKYDIHELRILLPFHQYILVYVVSW